MRTLAWRRSLRQIPRLGLVITALVIGLGGLYVLLPSHAATYVVSGYATNAKLTSTAVVRQVNGASRGQAVQFGSKAGDCNNFCSKPVNPIFQTAPVSVNIHVNSAWCGPTWDAPQAEFDLARQKLGAEAILMPPCKKGGGYFDQTPEQYKIELDKAQRSGVKVVVFPGYVCSNAFDHKCYLGYVNPDAAIDKFAYHPALAGIMIHDEPPGQEFAATAKAVDRIHQRRPGLLAYTNLIGGFGTQTPQNYYGTGPNGKTLTFEQYVAYFIKTVKIDVMSVDDYTSPTTLDSTLRTITNQVALAKAGGRSDLANYALWSAISTIGLPDGRDANTMLKQQSAFVAVNAKYGAKTLFFTWRSPPAGGGDGFNQPAVGPALCGKVNNGYTAGTMCGN